MSQEDSAGGTGSQGKPAAGNGGVGVPDDAVSAFAKAITDAGKAALKEETGDPNVSVAFQLGWTIEIVTNSPGDDTVKTLPGLDDYADGTFPKILGERVSGALTKLTDVVTKAGLEIPTTAVDLTKSLATGVVPDAATMQAVHGDLVAILMGADRKLARAYGLGRALRRLTSRPRRGNAFASPEILLIINGLDDLSSAFPPHAARSVAISIDRWRTTLAGHTPSDIDELRRQGELWRALLGAEKLGRDMLEPDNYLDAAKNLARRYSRIAWRALVPLLPWLVFALVLFLGGVALIVANDKDGSVIAGIGGILASLGLTWKGVGGALGDLAGKLEKPLWGAELDAGIADAITLIGAPPASSSTRGDAANRDYGGRRARAGLPQAAPSNSSAPATGEAPTPTEN